MTDLKKLGVLYTTRNDIPKLLNALGLCGEGAEIGVKQGKYSLVLLKRWGGGKLYSVDPWLYDPSGQYVDRANVPQSEQEKFCQQTAKILSPFKEKSVILRMTSVEAAKQIEDQSLDFVYIDARHDYDSVLQDLRTWFPKMRPGGLMAGHDYKSQRRPDFVNTVKKAVDTFFKRRHKVVCVTTVDWMQSWLVLV